MAEEAENTPAKPDRAWTPVVPVPQETVAVAMFQWKRLPLTKKIVLRYCALFAAIVIGTAILGYVVSSMGAPQYGARSEINYPLDQPSASGGFLREDRTLQTQLVAMKSQAVLQPVADKFKLSIEELSKKVTATVVQDSNVIRVQVVDSSPSAREAAHRCRRRRLLHEPRQGRRHADARAAEQQDHRARRAAHHPQQPDRGPRGHPSCAESGSCPERRRAAAAERARRPHESAQRGRRRS